LGVAPENLLNFVLEQEAKGDPVDSCYDPRQWDLNWDTYCFEDEGSYSYWFRSTERTAKEEEIKDSDTFLDTLLRGEDAWLPTWDYFPVSWSEDRSSYTFQSKKVKNSNFVRVDALHYTDELCKIFSIDC